MKIDGVAILACCVAVLGLAPFASATRIDFDNLTKYSFDSTYGQKENRGSIIIEFAKNGGLGALKSELKEWKQEVKNGWQGGSYVNAKNSSAQMGPAWPALRPSLSSQSVSCCWPDGMSGINVRLEECRSRRLTVSACI